MSAQSKEPEVVYHYTTQAGLLGILGKRELWATKAHYMDDSAEFSHGLDLARQLLAERLADAREDDDKARIAVLLQDLDAIAMVNVFVASFSEEHDLLSQWRSYGEPRGGFALGFKAKLLTGLSATHGFSLKQCQYAPDVQLELVRELIDAKLAERFNPRVLQFTPRTPDALGFAGDFAVRISELASILKHPKFQEEREWRLVSKWIPASVPQFSHRTGSFAVTPYFALPLGPSPGVLVEVGIGPTEHKALAKSAIQSLLLRHAYKDVGIVVSDTPLRPRSWQLGAT